MIELKLCSFLYCNAGKIIVLKNKVVDVCHHQVRRDIQEARLDTAYLVHLSFMLQPSSILYCISVERRSVIVLTLIFSLAECVDSRL